MDIMDTMDIMDDGRAFALVTTSVLLKIFRKKRDFPLTQSPVQKKLISMLSIVHNVHKSQIFVDIILEFGII